MALEFPDEDIASFLAAEGITTEIDYAESGVGVLPSRQIFDSRRDCPLPTEFEPLPLTTKEYRILSTNTAVPRGVRHMRHTAMDAIGRYLTTSEILDLNVVDLNELELGIAELLQNAWRHGGGIHEMILGRTATGRLCAAARNLSPIYPDATVMHDRPSGRPVILGRAPLVADRTEELRSSDQHGWGLYLTRQVVIDSGSFEEPYPVVSEFPVKTPDGIVVGSVPLKALVAWNEYGRSESDDEPPMLAA